MSFGSTILCGNWFTGQKPRYQLQLKVHVLSTTLGPVQQTYRCISRARRLRSIKGALVQSSLRVRRASTGSGADSHTTTAPDPMEVEVKLRLSDAKAYSLAEAAFSAGHVASHRQENFFFDGSGKQLSSKMAILRLRFINTDEKAILTLKGQQVVSDGIGRAAETEEDIDARAAREYVKHPDGLLKLDSELMTGIQRDYGVTALLGLGGFKNLRKIFKWEGFTVELDETQYEFGTLYEIECETDKPEALRDKLERLLIDQGIGYRYSKRGKFAHFIHKTLDD